MLKGIDVSSHQGEIDWAKVKGQVDFAIIRLGYGSDIAKQDDARFAFNVAACVRYGIPYAVYLYSYADTVEKVNSEIQHALRLLKGLNPFCVYYDMEDDSTVKCGKAILTNYAIAFCEAMKSNGYKPGIYANQNWCRNHIDIALLAKHGYSVWVAKYSSESPVIAAEYDIWQNSSSGHIEGIQGNVDTDFMYKDIRSIATNTTPAKKSIEEVANLVCDGKYGNNPERKNKLKAEGYTDSEISAIQNRVNEIMKSRQNTSKPAPATQTIIYTVKRNDNLTKIAKKYGTTISKIAKDNNIKDVDKIYIGQKLKIIK